MDLFSLAVGVHKWLWLAVLVWRKANEASVCVCESLGPEKKGWQWLDTQSINLFLYVQGHCVSFLSFAPFFFFFLIFILMRSHFILGEWGGHRVFICAHICLDQFCTSGKNQGRVREKFWHCISEHQIKETLWIKYQVLVFVFRSLYHFVPLIVKVGNVFENTELFKRGYFWIYWNINVFYILYTILDRFCCFSWIKCVFFANKVCRFD